jgi:hypothetical protein
MTPMIPTSVFQLGRMRHLDLLALWHWCHPDSKQYAQLQIGRLSRERLIANLVSLR